MTAASFFVLFKSYQAVLIDNQSLLSSSLNFGNILAVLLSLISLLGFVMFGGITITFALRFFNSQPQVIVSKEGIEDKRLNFGLIRWNEIEEIYFEETKYSKWLSLFLVSPENYFDKLPLFQKFLRKANGQSGNNFFRIRFEDLDKPIEEAMTLIEKYIAESRNEMALAD